MSETMNFKDSTLFGETENWRPRVYFDAEYVSAPYVVSKRPESPYGAKYVFLIENRFFQFVKLLALQDPFFGAIIKAR